MKQSKKSKLNNSCINLFRFLMLLYEDKAYYKDVINVYKSDIDEKSDNTTQVILNKAINALKVFGIKITKRNNKYHLDSSLYAFNYDFNDLKSIKILSNAITNFPEDDTKESISQFLKNLELRMDNSTKKTLSNISTNYDFSFYYKNLKEQIKECKEYVQTEMSFDIIYIQANGEEINTKGIAKDVTFDTKNAYLQMYDIINKVNVEIPLNSIRMLNVNPVKSKAQKVAMTITFKITGRLAKTYKLKENETLLEKDSKGNLIIINKNEPIEEFLKKMMKYSDCCQVLSPKTIKRKMQGIIDSTLSQYET